MDIRTAKECWLCRWRSEPFPLVLFDLESTVVVEFRLLDPSLRFMRSKHTVWRA
jgi:hypothetical protein